MMSPGVPLPESAEPRRPVEIARLQMARLVVEEAHPLPEALRTLCEIAAEALDVERVGIWLLTDDRKALRCANLYERASAEHSQGVTLHVTEYPEYVRSVAQRRALGVQSAQSDPRVAELRDTYLIPLGITSLLDAPVILKGGIIGVVCHEHVGPPRDWTTEDLDFAMSVADAVTTKMKWAELMVAKASLQHYVTLARSAERFELESRFATGVAHDFRNLLTVVLGNAVLIGQCRDLPANVVSGARQIEEAAERGASLIRVLMDFGREPSGVSRVLNVPAAIEHFLPLLQAAVGVAHPIVLSPADGGCKVLIDQSNLERGLLNLVLNARDAMPTGGPILIHTAIDHASERQGYPVAYVRVDVVDTGTGISPADQERMFEPFFTTKAPGKGTGLGLPSVRRILNRAGGFVRVESAIGEGTKLSLFFPRVTGDPIQPKESP